MSDKNDKIIITVVGKDAVGIIARICTYLADHNVNVSDISQTIVDGFFNMMMICQMQDDSLRFEKMSLELAGLGKEIGVDIRAQRSEIFEMMHRV